MIKIKGKKVFVSKDVCERIKTVKDLNDFYAWCEADGVWDYAYTFETNNEHIDELVYEMNYKPGVYDKINVERILGESI